MKLDKLTIKSNGEEFTVMVNPKEFSTTDSIGYVNSGQKQCKKYKGKNSTRISIPDIFLDTTGAIPVEEWPLDGTIDQMIEKLKKMVYKFDGDAHETPIVEVTWGSKNFKARLVSMETKYTLFDVEGGPLRAIVKLVFDTHQTLKEIEAEANRHSPDLTHIIEVKSGDTLPNLCNKVYKDPSFYMQVARINGLSSFCHLKPGTRLVFPPLVD